MAKDGHRSKDLNYFKVKLKTFREGAVRPNREQPEIKLVIWILNMDQVVDNSLFAPYLCYVNPMADMFCFSAMAKKDFFFSPW